MLINTGGTSILVKSFIKIKIKIKLILLLVRSVIALIIIKFSLNLKPTEPTPRVQEERVGWAAIETLIFLSFSFFVRFVRRARKNKNST